MASSVSRIELDQALYCITGLDQRGGPLLLTCPLAFARAYELYYVAARLRAGIASHSLLCCLG